MVVTRSNDVVIGQVLAIIHRYPDKPTELYIDNLAVSEPFQRKGIATQMVKEIFSIGVKRGCKEIWVATETDNEPAIECYKALNLTIRTALVFEGGL